MFSGIPVPTSWVRLWSGIMEDICAMVLLWKKVFTMTCSWKKGKYTKLYVIAFCRVIVSIGYLL